MGSPLTLSVFVDAPDGRPARWWVGWAKFTGPGEVAFSQYEMLADYRYDNRATTTVTFSEPGGLRDSHAVDRKHSVFRATVLLDERLCGSDGRAVA